MLEIEYTATPTETARTTLDFMSNRPVMSMMILFMRVACLCLLFGFALMLYNHQARQQDYVYAASALMWLLFYQKFNRWVIKGSLNARKFNEIKYLFRIDEQSIFYQIHNYQPQNVQWKKLKYVLKNKDGYIIPLTGLANAGKFLWVPLRCLITEQQSVTFTDLLKRSKLKIKNI